MVERINPLKKQVLPVGETAGVEEALSQREAASLKLVSVLVGDPEGRQIEAMADLEQRIVVPVAK